MTIQKAIELSIEGGYTESLLLFERVDDHSKRNMISVALLDPQFWESLGKAMGWSEEGCPKCGKNVNGLICEDCGHDTIDGLLIPAWLYQWHKFIDHLAEGKDIQSFFNQL